MSEIRLLVINANSQGAIVAKGHAPELMGRYFNPAGYFAQYCVLNVFHEPPIEGVPFLEVAPVPEMSAWRESNADPWSLPEVDSAALRRFFPGLPAAWVDAVRVYAPTCIRAYDPGWAGLLGLELSRTLGVPLLVSVHNTMGICGEVVRDANSVMALSEAVAARCIELGADPARVVTVANRLDRQRFSTDAAPAIGPDGSPRLLSVAREHPQKNLDRILEACAQSAKSLPQLRLVHFGNSRRDWSKHPFVTHMDSVPNSQLPGWYRWADALLMPSLYEGFGMALVEALACGTPCITSRRGPMDELVTDRWDGLLVNPEDTADIARAIREIADPGLRARLAAPARAATERFDLAVVDARESALYASLLDAKWPKVSVVLPTYKRERLIEAAVRNVLAQDYPDFELIVVNDGSPDGTSAILERLQGELADPRLTVLHRQNGGLPRALNTGFEAARGEFWTWTSDDNAYRPGALLALARELMLDPGAGLVYSDMQIIGPGENRSRFVAGPPEKLDDTCCVGGSFMYRAGVAKLVGEYDPHFTLVEDYDYWLRMRKHTRFVWLPRVLYDYGDEPDSLTHRRFEGVQEKRLELMQREHGNRADWGDRYFAELCRYSAMSKQYGLPGVSFRVAMRAVRSRPRSAKGWWAVLRALTPRVILNLSRRLRGLDAN